MRVIINLHSKTYQLVELDGDSLPEVNAILYWQNIDRHVVSADPQLWPMVAGIFIAEAKPGNEFADWLLPAFVKAADCLAKDD